MKLATLRDKSRDGRLVAVSRDLQRFCPTPSPWHTLQGALDAWDEAMPALVLTFERLQNDLHCGEPLDFAQCAPPLPRAYEWVDGSAYINHIILVRKARGAEPPATLKTDPLVYQGGSGVLLGARAPLPLPDASWGLDFESEIVVILGDTPQGCDPSQASSAIRLLTLVNDVTYRNLIPAELAKGFGFFCSKPATAFAPVVATPDELAPHFRSGRLYRRLRSTYNGTLIGDCDAGEEMHFSFHDLIHHITKTRAFTAGTVLGSGTVANVDPARGVSCLAERRMVETIEHGAPTTPFMKVGDRIHIDMLDDHGHSIFGAIDQQVVAP